MSILGGPWKHWVNNKWVYTVKTNPFGDLPKSTKIFSNLVYHSCHYIRVQYTVIKKISLIFLKCKWETKPNQIDQNIKFFIFYFLMFTSFINRSVDTQFTVRTAYGHTPFMYCIANEVWRELKCIFNVERVTAAIVTSGFILGLKCGKRGVVDPRSMKGWYHTIGHKRHIVNSFVYWLKGSHGWGGSVGTIEWPNASIFGYILKQIIKEG